MTSYAPVPNAAAMQIIMIVNSTSNFSVCLLLTSIQTLCLYSSLKSHMHAMIQCSVEISNYLCVFRGCAAFPVIIS